MLGLLNVIGHQQEVFSYESHGVALNAPIEDAIELT